MKLEEFYDVTETHDVVYTLTQEGHLVEWDHVFYNDTGEIMYVPRTVTFEVGMKF